MNKKQAAEQIGKLFQGAFNRETFNHFLRNLLNDVETRNNHYSGKMVPDAFKQHVNQYWRVGKYTDPEDIEMDLYIVEVKSLSKLDRARTALRNFAVRSMQTFGDKDHALIAFYAKEDKGADWRFSYVKIERTAKLDEKRGKVKLETKLTPAKRYSFLVGEHENSHTAQAQLIDLLAMDYANPTVEEIEKAFSIEKVTKEFFEQYKDLFVRLSEVLIKQDFFLQETDEKKRKQIVAKFAKKLLGQIVFLYFLQKKGWLGVDKDGQWGKGERRFLRKLFTDAENSGKQYYVDKLQFLFYEALANDRKDQFDPSYYQRFDCKIPFLNGGLFEADYDWQKITINIPNTIFSNTNKTKAGDTGTGILDVFDRYNFTIKEDEPLEKEVAVDPEMLGKVFENMLEITERKSKGAFYTPREIVHYMCQESLIHYLNATVGQATVTNIPQTDIETLVRKGIFAIDNDQRILKTGKETQSYTFKLPESIRTNAELIDDKLADIKICDPAIGSGAFPLGMLHEIVHARQALVPHIPKDKHLRPYELKKNTIRHSLYGVDIDPSAIDIARLRLWLSLVVDEDDYTTIDALPNLDYKIMQGNSLIEEYEGVKLFDEQFIETVEDSDEQKLIGYQNKIKEIQEENKALYKKGSLTDERKNESERIIKNASAQITRLKNKISKNYKIKDSRLFDIVNKAKNKANQLKALQNEYFDIASPAEKRRLRDKITTLEWELIEATLEEQNKTDALAKLSEYKSSGEKPWFLWKLNFSEVFKEKGGFDIVIGNPPYIFGGSTLISQQDKIYYKKTYYSGSKKINLFTIFIEKSTRLLRSGAGVSFIVPNTLLRVTSYSNIRKYLVENCLIKEIVDLDIGIFDKVTASTITFLIENTHYKDQTGHYVQIKKGVNKTPWQYIEQSEFKQQGFVYDIFSSTIDRKILKKLNQTETKLGRIASLIRFGVVISGNFDEVVSEKKMDETWKPFLEGDEISAYGIQYSGRYLHYKKEILHRSRTPNVFETPKIMIQRITGGSTPIKAVFDASGFYNKESIINLILKDNSYHYMVILAILNSEIANWYYAKRFTNFSKLTVNLSKEYLSEIPIPEISSQRQAKIGQLACYCSFLSVKTESLLFVFLSELIDGLMYEIYFTDEIISARKEILPHLGNLKPLTENMSEEEKLTVIQHEFERLYDPNHPVRNHLETLDSVEEVRIIREALKK